MSKTEDEKTKVIRAVVEAVTEKYGGGVKLEGAFYNLAEGLELPEKGEEIMAKILGRTVVEWWKAEKEEKEKEEESKKSEEKGRKQEKELLDVEVPEDVKAVTDMFLAILKQVDEKVPNIAAKDKIIVTSVIFKEIMETKRAKIKRMSGE